MQQLITDFSNQLTFFEQVFVWSLYLKNYNKHDRTQQKVNDFLEIRLRSKIQAPYEVPEHPFMFNNIMISNDDCIKIAYHEYNITGRKPTIMSLANAKDVLGAFLRSPGSQEEHLGYYSNLIDHLLEHNKGILKGQGLVKLMTFMDIYIDNYLEKHGGPTNITETQIRNIGAEYFNKYSIDDYCFVATYAAVVTSKLLKNNGGYKRNYCTNVFFFYKNKGTYSSFLADVVLPAAFDNRLFIGDGKLTKNNRDKYLYTYNEINNGINQCLLYNPKGTCILGALGCGEFNNEPKMIAKIFKDLLTKEKFKYLNIHFAIYDHKGSIINTFRNIFNC